MIAIKDKHLCCGCSACVQVCPVQCISFDEDQEGFRYPLVDKGKCIDCHLCEKVCPELHQVESRKPLKVYAAMAKDDDLRMKSSSGGIFTLLAEKVIDEGGVVFGARFDENWEIKHDYTETKEGLAAFRRSKYLQSRIEGSYIKAKEFLEADRKVLFTGTPCQIRGLKLFLREDYDNLLTVDVVCHGVPSPLVWREYLRSLKSEKNEIAKISFRDKSIGWKRFRLKIQSANGSQDETIINEPLNENIYLRIFLKNLDLRPSCFKCPAKAGKSISDMTIADYWGISNKHPDWDDDKGTSLVLVYSDQGFESFGGLNARSIETNYEEGLRSNSVIEKSVPENKYVSKFWDSFNKYRLIKVETTILNKIKPSIWTLFIGKAKSAFKQIGK